MRSCVFQAVFIVASLAGQEAARVDVTAQALGASAPAPSKRNVAASEQAFRGTVSELGSIEHVLDHSIPEDASILALMEQTEQVSFGDGGRYMEGRRPFHNTDYFRPENIRDYRAPPHYGPRPDRIFHTIAAAVAARAILASTKKPPQLPRGDTVVMKVPLRPNYINDMHGKGRMMQLKVSAPAWCWPCKGESMHIVVGGTGYYFTTPPQIYKDQTFTLIVPAVSPYKFVPEVILTPTFVSEMNLDKTMQVQVPTSHGPGMTVSVRMPEGDIRKKKVPLGVFHPDFFNFTYNPTAEAETHRQRELKRNLDGNYRCCCQKVDNKCLWYPNEVLKSGQHCPRLVERDDQPKCTKSFCGLFGDGCTKTRHGPGQCTYSLDSEHFFTGGKC